MGDTQLMDGEQLSEWDEDSDSDIDIDDEHV